MVFLFDDQQDEAGDEPGGVQRRGGPRRARSPIRACDLGARRSRRPDGANGRASQGPAELRAVRRRSGASRTCRRRARCRMASRPGSAAPAPSAERAPARRRRVNERPGDQNMIAPPTVRTAPKNTRNQTAAGRRRLAAQIVERAAGGAKRQDTQRRAGQQTERAPRRASRPSNVKMNAHEEGRDRSIARVRRTRQHAIDDAVMLDEIDRRIVTKSAGVPASGPSRCAEVSGCERSRWRGHARPDHVPRRSIVRDPRISKKSCTAPRWDSADAERHQQLASRASSSPSRSTVLSHSSHRTSTRAGRPSSEGGWNWPSATRKRCICRVLTRKFSAFPQFGHVRGKLEYSVTTREPGRPLTECIAYPERQERRFLNKTCVRSPNPARSWPRRERRLGLMLRAGPRRS